MKVYNFYSGADKELWPSQRELGFDESLAACTSMLTESMVLYVISRVGSGSPPWTITIPSSIAFDYATWNIPSSLLTVKVVEDGEDDHRPISKATIQFGDSIANIHSRRCLPIWKH